MPVTLDMALVVRKVGRVEYAESLEAMRKFTAERSEATPDELWILEHPPVYTLGLAADPAHAPKGETGIPVVRVERGQLLAQVTRARRSAALCTLLWESVCIMAHMVRCATVSAL